MNPQKLTQRTQETGRYWCMDWWSTFRFRTLESYGDVWQIQHYFLPRDQLPFWLKDDPPLDLSKLDLRFAAKPKAKKIPDLQMSAGQIYMKAITYEQHFQQLIGNVVTAMPVFIDEARYVFIRPDVEIDCVDLDRSEWRQRDDGFRYSWPRLVLKDIPPDAPPIFRPGHGPEFWKKPVFSENFTTICKANKIIGAVFEEVFPLKDVTQTDG